MTGKNQMNIHSKIQWLLVILLFTGNSQADILLTSENLNTSLKQMQRLQQSENNNSANSDEQYQLGVEASALAKLLTAEVIGHGAEQESLITLALQRCAELNVNIRWFGRLKRFFYDGDGYKEYLDSFPNGEHIADATFQLLELGYYLSETTGPESLAASILKMEDFLGRYPDFEQISEVELYLAINYRDLWRQYRDNEDSETVNKQMEKTRLQFEYIIEKYEGKDKGDIAKRLLDRFNKDVEKNSKL
jgi:TolA-binding protein